MLDIGRQRFAKNASCLTLEIFTMQGCLRKRNAIFVVDRDFVNRPFGDAQKKAYEQTSITRWKDNLIVKSSVSRPLKKSAMNEGVISDDSIALNASTQEWRRIHYKSPEGKELIFFQRPNA